jgi:cytochrome c oxidase cbb3-type subunit I/II
MLSDTKRYGEYSKPGEFVYDHPFQWGSRRIGPDLAREGGKQSHLWHLQHFENPQIFNEGSIMPSYAWLIDGPFSEINYQTLPQRVQSAAFLGAPYDRELEEPVEMAKEQAKLIAEEIVAQGGPEGLEDKKVVALIAYVQRLGTDLFKAPETEEEAAEEGDESTTEDGDDAEQESSEDNDVAQSSTTGVQS